ncbi:SusC/RagA family TonB-linked outer membrane protein [Tellurirhabdus bombi]|uniref:SusC/RagA family TonB-linked outer membrane protein n=1 Tax=Tellurirhabdus bombi TaxID=2907205 RepID=UPI001F23BE72|nr:TonB-dependent receptor [Tellurirhabdus bombi]
MRKVLLLCFFALLLLPSSKLWAQERTISGSVTAAEDGAFLPGVNVVVKGTSQGSTTDAGGKYTLSVPASGGTLVFSFIGFDSKEVQIGNQSTVNVALTSNASDLNEVVVIGYGTQQKRDLTGSIASISGKEIATAPVQSFDQALQGRAAGVNITTPNGVLNNPPVIRIRGVNSINLSSSPLIVIDGIPAFTGNTSAVGSVANNPLSNLNPADIESMEVLKDASASAIYGSRASAGVILVTTKKGAKGRGRFSFDSWAGWSNPVRLYDILNADQYMTIKNEAVRNLNANRAALGQPATNVEGFRPTLDANGNPIDTRWYDYIYRTGFSTSNTLSFSGGTDKTSYYMSLGYSNQNGMIKRNEFKRTSARVNVDHKVYKTFTVGARIGYSNNFNSAPNTGSLADAAFNTAGLGRSPLVLPPNVPAYNPDGSYNTSAAGIGAGANVNPQTGAPLLPGYYNPVVDLDKNSFTSEGNEIQGSVYLNWEIVKGLNARTTFGVNNIGFEDKSFQTAIAGDGYSTGGSASNFYRTNKRWNWQNTLQYDRTFAEKHNFSLLLGTEEQHTVIQRWGANRTTLADGFFETFQGNFTNIAASGNYQSENYLVSYFGRLNYDFGKKYLASVNFRRDGYSAWANKWGNFYGASLGYVISEEAFWKDAAFGNVFNFLKVTGSYGEVGNSQGIDDFASLQTYSSALYGANATLYFSGAGNPALTWETSKKTDIGLTFGLLQDRIQGDLSYYKNLVDGLILNVPLAPSKGVPSNSIPANVGSMQNTGIEVNVKVNAIRNGDFNWTVSGNLTTLKNRVLSLVTQGQRIATSTGDLETVNFTETGRSVGELLVVRSLGVNPANGRRLLQKADGTVVQYDHQGTGWTTLEGQTTTAPTQAADGVYYGPTLPKWYGGLDNTFRYKGFDLGVFIQFSGGNYIYNGTRAGLGDMRFWNNGTHVLDRWTPENPNGTVPRVVYTDNVSNGSALPISENVFKGDFARLRNVSLGYTLNSTLLSRLNIANARIYAQVQNAALLTNYKGIDPEISTNSSGTRSNTGSGVDRNSIGQARTFTVGINLGF